MKSKYVIVGLLLAAVYAALKKWIPDFPLSEESFVTIALYIMVKLGLELSWDVEDAIWNFKEKKAALAKKAVKKAKK